VIVLGCALVVLALWWGWWNYRLGLRKGRELGRVMMLVELAEPEELMQLLDEAEEVEELRRLYKAEERGSS